MTELSIRPATPDDAPQVLSIYGPIVETTAISFETECPNTEGMVDRIRSSNETHCWLVAECGDVLAGYAYATPLKSRAAYRYSTETTIYLHSDYYGKGLGTVLYEALFDELKELGFYNAFAGMTLPNPASVALHEKLGFESVGIFRSAGYKFGQWHDVSWWQRPIRSGKPP